MKIDPNNNQSLKNGAQYFKKLSEGKAPFEIKKISQSRSALQNRALHKYFKIISDALNDLGMEFEYSGFFKEPISTRYTENIVKEHIWKPLQMHYFNIESTRDINTQQMNEIIEVFSMHFARKGVNLVFPSKDLL